MRGGGRCYSSFILHRQRFQVDSISALFDVILCPLIPKNISQLDMSAGTKAVFPPSCLLTMKLHSEDAHGGL